MIIQLRVAQYYKVVDVGEVSYRENTYYKLQIGVDGKWEDIPTVFIEESAEEFELDTTNVVEFKPK